MKKLLALILILTCVAVFGQGYPAYRQNSPLTAAEKTQALVGSTTVDFVGKEHGGVKSRTIHGSATLAVAGVGSTTVALFDFSNILTWTTVRLTGSAQYATSGGFVGQAQYFDVVFMVQRQAYDNVVVQKLSETILTSTGMGGTRDANVAFSSERTGAEANSATQEVAIYISNDDAGQETNINYSMDIISNTNYFRNK